LGEIKEMKKRGEVGMGEMLNGDMDKLIDHGLKNLGMYHPVPPLDKAKNGDIVVKNMNLLYFYHNRLLGYELENFS
jgi:glycerol-3-phosphate O-acyltransferase